MRDGLRVANQTERNPRLSSRLLDLNGSLDSTKHREHDPGQNHAQERQSDLAQPDGDTDGSGHPDARGRGQALDLALFAQLENGARSDETNAGCETLDYTRQITRRHSCRRSPEDEKRAAHRSQHMRAQTRGFPVFSR